MLIEAKTTSADSDGSAEPLADLRPDLRVLATGALVVALISAVSLPPSLAIASTVLGVLMIAGADIDARTFLLPDLVTLGALACGVLTAFALDPFDPIQAAGLAMARAFLTALAVALVRWGYGWARGREGIGLGDVKLAAAIGAWLPLESIPACFLLAIGGALVAVAAACRRGEAVSQATRVPFGAFLCPALWLTFYFNVFLDTRYGA